MKRSTIVKILASEIARENTGHYSYNGTDHASDVLNLLEQLGLVKPTHTITVPRMCMMGSEYEEQLTLNGWEKE
jgi:hypothetical protein